MSKLENKYNQNGIGFLVIFFILVNLMHCQMPKPPPIIPLVDDIPYIECDICQKAAKVLYKNVKAKREQISPMKVCIYILTAKNLSVRLCVTLDLIDFSLNICYKVQWNSFFFLTSRIGYVSKIRKKTIFA